MPGEGRFLLFLLRRDNRTALLPVVLGVFAVATLYLVFWHEPRGDEATPWVIVRNLDFRGLFYMLRHNGHPILWFLCIKAVQSLGFNYLAMEILNWMFSLWGIWLLFYRSALPLFARFGVALAPICCLEVAFTSRNYAIAMPLVFLAACFYPTARARPLRYSMVLALLASTNVFASAVFVGISLQFLVDQAWHTGSFAIRPLYTRFLLPNLIIVLGALLLFLQLAPIRFPGDPFPDINSTLAPSFYNVLKPHYLLLCVVSLALVFFQRIPRVVGGVPPVLLALIPIVTYGGTGRHFFMIELGIVYYFWVYLDDFIASGKFAFFRLGPRGVCVLCTLMIVVPVLTLKRNMFSELRYQPDERNTARAIIGHGLDTPNSIMVATDPFRTMAMFLFLKNIREDYVPPEFGPSPQSYALDAYVRILLKESLSADDMKPLVLEVSRRNPGKTIVLVIGGAKAVLDPQSGDPNYQLTSIYESPAKPAVAINDEYYRVFVLQH